MSRATTQVSLTTAWMSLDRYLASCLNIQLLATDSNNLGISRLVPNLWDQNLTVGFLISSMNVIRSPQGWGLFTINLSSNTLQSSLYIEETKYIKPYLWSAPGWIASVLASANRYSRRSSRQPLCARTRTPPSCWCPGQPSVAPPGGVRSAAWSGALQ